jgi:probable H4MPT-linked C1 transfer pathway protein
MSIDVIGWDIGGAHLKAVALHDDGRTLARQEPTPLWQGLDHLHRAIQSIITAWPESHGCRHGVTMTGELVDLFPNREEGVRALTDALLAHVPAESVSVFAGEMGFLAPATITPDDILRVASANWLATALFTAARLPDALLIDIGSTTTDLLLIGKGRPQIRGTTDLDRLRYQELVYTGVVRTSLMAIASQAPWQGEWASLMAEHFATTADVYRLTGELPDHADQMPAADGGEKSLIASARRIARLLGTDAETASLAQWQTLARYFRQQQLETLRRAAHRQLSCGLADTHRCFVGAGVGRFLVQELAQQLGYPYRDFLELMPMPHRTQEFDLADCAPAAAVAFLLNTQHADR